MKSTKIDLSPEKALVTNMIVSTQFLKEVSGLVKPQWLEAGYARVVAEWVLDYWGRFKEAPGKNIQEIYQFEKAKMRDEEDAENLAEFLRRLSADWKKVEVHNVEYAVSQALHFLKLRSLSILRDQLESALDDQDPTKAEQHLAKFKRVEPSFGEAVSLLRDGQEVINAFLQEDELLMRLPGALGDIAGNINRGDFFAFLAPMKRGKTWWLLYVAIVALSYGLKVVFFSLEMTKKQIIRRAWQSMTGESKSDGEVTVPYFEEIDRDGETRWIVRTKQVERPVLDAGQIRERQKKFKSMFRSGDLRIIALPSNSATVEDLEAHLDNLQHYDEFEPDLVLVDYADILAPTPSFRGDYRHQIDDIWKKLRRLAQKRLFALGTASQAEKSTFNEDVSQIHVSEDIRKLAHVTCMIGLNQKKNEAEAGIMRVSQVAVREGRQVFQQAIVLQCLDIGRPALDSRLRSDVITDEDEDEVPRSRGGRRPRN